VHHSSCALVVQEAGSRKFMTELPQNAFSNGKFLNLPIMVGSTRDDGSAFIPGTAKRYFIS